VSDRTLANRLLAEQINREIWNERQFDRVPRYFHEDFVADYSPYGTHQGRDEIVGMVERAHAAFDGFHERILMIVADDDHVVMRITTTGRHTGPWGPLAPTGHHVEFDELVVMTIRDNKVIHQTGIVDNLTALRQLDVIPGPPPERMTAGDS
jgi:predicted ester cyclase